MNYVANMMARNPNLEMIVDSEGTYLIVDANFADDGNVDNTRDVDVYLYPAGEPEGHWHHTVDE